MMLNLSNLIGGVVKMAPKSSYPVEALSWDITLGTATSGLGQLILEKTSSSSEMVPEAVDHVGVVVFGYLYEYGDQGILKTVSTLQSNPKSKYPVFGLRDRETVGETEKTQEEFEKWVAVMNETDFEGSDYNVVTTSCVVWGIKACEFLGVSHPKNWDKICDWANENSRVAGLIGGSGVQARKVQIKAQASETPRKIVTYFKKKVKTFRSGSGSGDEDNTEVTVTEVVESTSCAIAKCEDEVDDDVYVAKEDVDVADVQDLSQLQIK